MFPRKSQHFAFSSMRRLSYATALRCIAQDLDRRGIKAFDLRVRGETLAVEGGYQEPPAPTPVSIEYTAQDVDDLDRAGEARRGESRQGGEFINAIQVFRTIGAYLDKNAARLARLTNNHGRGKDSLFLVEYINSDGERIVEDRAGSELYDMCVQMYKQRGRLTGTEGPRSKWRR